MLRLSIIIPCYNEENNLKRGVLTDVYDFLKSQKFTWEVIICDDDSSDNSFQIASKFSQTHSGFKVIKLPHGGKPSAVWGGIKSAHYPYVLFTDMDQSTPLSEITKLIPYISKGFDFIIGSRGVERQGNSLIRKIMAKTFLSMRRMVLLSNIIDTQCGFKLIKTDLAKKLFPHLQFFRETKPQSGWRVSAFDVELLFMAQKSGVRIQEVPVSWKNEDTSTTKGDDNSRFKKESVQMLREIIRVKRNDLTGYYDQIKI